MLYPLARVQSHIANWIGTNLAILFQRVTTCFSTSQHNKYHSLINLCRRCSSQHTILSDAAFTAQIFACWSVFLRPIFTNPHTIPHCQNCLGVFQNCLLPASLDPVTKSLCSRCLWNLLLTLLSKQNSPLLASVWKWSRLFTLLEPPTELRNQFVMVSS